MFRSEGSCAAGDHADQTWEVAPQTDWRTLLGPVGRASRASVDQAAGVGLVRANLVIPQGLQQAHSVGP